MEKIMRKTIEKYFQAWIDVDLDTVKKVFSDDVIYTECYGPEYHGLSQIVRWFTDWNQKGRVLEWTIKRMVEQDKTIVVEWYFSCDYEGNVDGFDGVTIADFNDTGKIFRLREFQSKPEHNYPYGI